MILAADQDRLAERFHASRYDESAVDEPLPRSASAM
jgi:hypothetical protein